MECSSHVCWLWHVEFTFSLRKCEALRDKEPLSISVFSLHCLMPFTVSHTDLMCVCVRQRWKKAVLQVTTKFKVLAMKSRVKSQHPDFVFEVLNTSLCLSSGVDFQTHLSSQLVQCDWLFYFCRVETGVDNKNK